MRLADIAVAMASTLTVALIAVIAILGWYQFIDGTFYKPVLELENNILQTTRCYYMPGETVQAKFKFKKNRNRSGYVKWNLVDNRLFEYRPRWVTLPQGDYDVLIDIEKLPEHLPTKGPDEAWKFSGTVEYKINPIKSVVYPLETSEFVIVRDITELKR